MIAKIKVLKIDKKKSPSTIPHGYFLPRIFLPPTSKTVLLPTTANGIRCKNGRDEE